MTPDGSETVTAKNVDLSNCDREQIHIPGAIQPHGAMVVLRARDHVILQASANTKALFGIEAQALLNGALDRLLGAEQGRSLRERLARETLDGGPCHVLTAGFPEARGDFNAFAHRVDDVIILELERIDDTPPPVLGLYSELQATIGRLQATTTLRAFFDLAVARIRAFTGYDRVLAYKFQEDGSGEVIAEATRDGLESYLGLNYPASDIPKPARRLFAMSWLRHLPDVGYRPVPLLPEKNPDTGAPVDMSRAILRSVSVMYSGYLNNMGVHSTMVMPLMKEGKLWGLISCMHHDAPRHVAYEARMAAEFLAHMLSLLMAAKENVETYEYRLKIKATLERLVERMSHLPIAAALSEGEPNALSLIQAAGAAIVVDGGLATLGGAPAEADLRGLIAWLAEQPETVIATDHLAKRYPPAESFRASASGLLAARLSRRKPDFVLWFRPEIVETVHWAGDPHKPVEVDTASGETRLMPRTSFALWKETVRGRARPWRDCEVEGAADLRRAVVEVVVDHAEELARINRELEKSNIELDSFAYVASHDLKEPLRGIHNYAHFIEEDSAGHLTEEDRERLQTIKRLTRRMDDLIESLLQYSRVGRVELKMVHVDLDQLVTQTLDLLRPRIEETRTSVRRPAKLPPVRGDRVRIGEVLSNLISNALKYNDKAERWIEIGVRDGAVPVFYVRDNGVGIEKRYHERVFEIFRRLHGRDQFGGGTGAGLTIAKRTVERHGGRIWVESEPGIGSTFFFTLAPDSRET